jgi:CheY-like chemotaxis protein
MSTARCLRIQASRMASIDLSGITALVVDDHEDTVDLFAEVLSAAGAIAHGATSLLEAMNGLTQSKVHVVVADIAMPGGSGIDLLVLMRQTGNVMPALAVTANLIPSSRDLILRSGFSAVIYKPVDPAQLVAVVAHLVGERRGF